MTDKIKQKSELLDSFIQTSTDNTLRRDYRLLKDKHREIDPDFKKKGNPLVPAVFNLKMCRYILQATNRLSVDDMHLSELPTLSEIKASGVQLSRKSVDAFVAVVT